jgi:hypothetical protein
VGKSTRGNQAANAGLLTPWNVVAPTCGNVLPRPRRRRLRRPPAQEPELARATETNSRQAIRETTDTGTGSSCMPAPSRSCVVTLPSGTIPAGEFDVRGAR